MDDEFSITLPSNVLSKEDPNNTPSKFVTRLNKTIQLSGAWEVAATRLQLQNRWYNFVKPQMLGVYVRDIKTSGLTYDAGDAELPNTPREEKQFNQVVSQWKNASWATDEFVKNMSYKCVIFPAGVYTSIEHVGSTLCNLINLAFKRTYEDLEFDYSYYENVGGNVKIQNEKTATKQKVYVIRIVTLPSLTDLDVMEVLGFTATMQGVFAEDNAVYKYYGATKIPVQQDIASMNTQIQLHYCQIRNRVLAKPTAPMVRQLMLYADVAALRSVGNIEAQLLDTVVVNAQPGEYEDALRGVTPNYVPVYRNTFSTIEIALTDHAGDQLHFQNHTSSPVIVTLRFRRVK